MSRIALSFGPQVVVVKGTTLDGSENTGMTIEKNNRGQLVVDVTAGFRPFWQDPVEILRILPSSGSVSVKVLDSLGGDLNLITVTAAEPFLATELFLSGREVVKFVATAEFQLLLRVVDKA